MAEAILNAMARQLVDLTLCKTRYDAWDLQWYTEGPFWRRTSMRYSRDYKIIPDYEIGDRKHGRTLEDILAESENLLDNLKQYRTTAEPSETDRTDYLLDHTQNLNVRTRLLLGERMTFDQMTEGLYCLTAPAVDCGEFDYMLEELAQALPGAGDVRARIAEFRGMLAIPPKRLLTVLKSATQVFHDIAVARMDVTGNSMPRVRVRELPNRDMVFLSILFGYDYNHIEYERNFNLLYPWTVDSVVEYIGHEMEPGHLTYFEKRLQTMIDTCWPEMSIVSQFSTSNAFGEGSARHAISMSFDNSMEKQVEFEKEIIFRNAGLDTELADLMPLWHRYCELSGYGKLEATRNMWNGVWDAQEALDFLKQYGFAEPDAGEEFIRHLPEDDGHFVAHDYARDVVRKYFRSVTEDVDEQWSLYEKLCCSHVSMRKIRDGSFTVTAPDPDPGFRPE